MEKSFHRLPNTKVLKALIVFIIFAITYITGMQKVYTLGEFISYFIITYVLVKNLVLGVALMLKGVKISDTTEMFLKNILIAFGFSPNYYINREVAISILKMFIIVLIAIVYFNGYFDIPITKLL